VSREQHILYKKLLLGNYRSSRLGAALLALCIGTTLLLLSVMIWWNFNELLHGKGDTDSLGSTFLTVSKRVTDENMGHPGATIFTPQEIVDLKNASQVQDAGMLISNHFPVYASLNDKLGFATEMFLEAVPDRFIDKKPDDWNWQPGNTQVPVILSAEFLNLYNYGFALSRGLPQLSQSTVKTISLDLKISYNNTAQHYAAHVTGFSDRISSVLVPESFITYGNKVYGDNALSTPSRLILKVQDASSKQFTDYLSQHDYVTNNEQLRWSKVRAIVAVVSAATGVLAILLMGIGALVFILFIELTISKAQQSLTLLLQLGVSPRYLSRFMLRRFLPLVLSMVGLSMCIAIVAQVGASYWAQGQNLQLFLLPGWPVWAAMGASVVLLVGMVRRSVVGAIEG
jgi:hypothetical protein